MSKEKKLYTAVTALALVALLGACNSPGTGTLVAPANDGVLTTNPYLATTAATPVSGDVTFSGVTKCDGSALSASELAQMVEDFPAMGADYDKLRVAVKADVAASGTVTEWDASGNVLLVIPTGGVGTIKSVAVSAGGTSEQGQCSGSTLRFELSATETSTSQGQGQEQGKKEEQPKEVKSACFHVTQTMACEAPKQEAPKQEEPKQEAPKQEAPKQEAPKQESPKQTSSPTSTQGQNQGSSKK